jgi:hypothetical protein
MESHQKGSLKMKCFSPSQNIDFLFYLRGILEIFFSISFFFFFYAPSLEDLGVLMIF